MKLRRLVKRIQRVKPWVDPDDAATVAATAAEEMARREALAAAAAEALLNVRCGSFFACCAVFEDPEHPDTCKC
jgi:hypothetical protein